MKVEPDVANRFTALSARQNLVRGFDQNYSSVGDSCEIEDLPAGCPPP